MLTNLLILGIPAMSGSSGPPITTTPTIVADRGRTVVIPSSANNSALLAFPDRDPSDVNDVSWDWSRYLSKRGETITAATITCAPGGILISKPPLIVANVVTVVIGGGANGSTYDLSCEVTSNLGFVYQRSASVSVAQL